MSSIQKGHQNQHLVNVEEECHLHISLSRIRSAAYTIVSRSSFFYATYELGFLFSKFILIYFPI